MRILVADDNEPVRRGIVGILSHDPDLEICGEASDSCDVIQKAYELRPDVILLDVSMPGGNGLQVASILKKRLPDLKILIVSQHDPRQILTRSLEAGAAGCIDKSRLATDLLPAIRDLQTVGEGQT